VKDSIQWRHEMNIVEPSALVVSAVVFYRERSAVLATRTIDILDYSVQIEPGDMMYAKVSMLDSCLGTKTPAPCTFKLPGRVAEPLMKPWTCIAPYGEHWALRIDENFCTVTAGTEATMHALISAVLRRCEVGAGEIEMYDSFEKIAELKSKAVELSGDGDGRSLDRVRELCTELEAFLDEKLNL
jgi:hypothetical protein